MLPKRVIKELNSIFKRFLWSGSDLDKKHNPVGWTQICTPLKSGGLGIKSLDIRNVSANLRHIWDINSG